MSTRLSFATFCIATTFAAAAFGQPVACETDPTLTLGMRIAREARSLAELGQDRAAGRLFLLAASCGLSRNVGLYAALGAYQDAENPEGALHVLELMAQSGRSDYQRIEENERFAPIVAQPGWPAVRQKMAANAASDLEPGASEPGAESGRVIQTDDLANFLAAFSQAEGLAGSEAAEVYDTLYLQPASPGLTDYASLKIRDPDAFSDYVQERRPYYAQLAKTHEALVELEERAESALRRLAVLAGQEEIPTIYFLVGAHTSAGTATGEGILLGAEFIGESLDHTNTLEDWVGQFLSTPADSIWVIVHEQAHFIQDNPLETVLGAVLNEGAADFLADHVFGPPTVTKGYTRYGECHEARIRQRLLETKDSDEISLWTGNNSTEYDASWHGDLGYFIGNQIVSAYFERADDKDRALKAIATLEDPLHLWEQSGYATLELDPPPGRCQ